MGKRFWWGILRVQTRSGDRNEEVELLKKWNLHEIAVHSARWWFWRWIFRVLVILNRIRLGINGWGKRWVAMEMSKWSLWKNETYMKLLSISLAFARRWLADNSGSNQTRDQWLRVQTRRLFWIESDWELTPVATEPSSCLPIEACNERAKIAFDLMLKSTCQSSWELTIIGQRWQIIGWLTEVLPQ